VQPNEENPSETISRKKPLTTKKQSAKNWHVLTRTKPDFLARNNPEFTQPAIPI